MIDDMMAAQFGVAQAMGCEIQAWPDGTGVAHPLVDLRTLNAVWCGGAPSSALIDHATAWMSERDRVPTLLLAEPSMQASDLLGARGWAPVGPVYRFMQHTGAIEPPHAEPSIVPMAAQHVAPFVSIVGGAFDWDAERIEHHVALYHMLLDRGIGRHYVVLIDDEPVATASLHAPAPGHPNHWGIYKVTTRAAYRGRGIGAALLRRLTRDAYDGGAQGVFLYTVRGGAAEALYMRLGWTPVFDMHAFAASQARPVSRQTNGGRSSGPRG